MGCCGEDVGVVVAPTNFIDALGVGLLEEVDLIDFLLIDVSYGEITVMFGNCESLILESFRMGVKRNYFVEGAIQDLRCFTF